jgi:hypothetical protein
MLPTGYDKRKRADAAGALKTVVLPINFQLYAKEQILEMSM